MTPGKDCYLRSYINIMKVTYDPESLPNPIPPGPAPDENTLTTLTINMTDAYGDGWNGYVFGFRQAGKIVATFGNNFRSGKNFGPVSLKVTKDVDTEIVVAVVGTWGR